MINWLTGISIAAVAGLTFAVVGAEAQQDTKLFSPSQRAPKWIDVSKVSSETLQVDLNAFDYLVDKDQRVINVLGHYRITDAKNQTPPVQLFWTDAATCNVGGGKLVAVLTPGSPPSARPWSTVGTTLYDKVGQTLCQFHEAVKRELKTVKPKYTT